MRHRSESLPGFVTPAEIIRAAIPALRPPRPISVSEAAEKWRVLRNPGGGYSGPWSNAFAPYLTEPMNAVQRRDVEEVVIVGPTQFGKSEIAINIVVFEAAEGGADVLLFQPTQALALDFAERRIEKAFDASDTLRALLGAERGDDKRMSKLFRNGARVTLAWPVSSQLASRPVPIVILDERDSMTDDVEGEGDPVELARQRTTSFGRHGKVVVMSTPKRQDGSGIIARWRAGDRRLFHWPCPHCGDYWTPGFDARREPTLAHLRLREDADEDQARAEAALICPCCGALIEERHKAGMNARGVWLPDGATIAADGSLGGAPVVSRRASFWISGLAVRTKSWGDLAARLVKSRKALEERQDEELLKTFWNADLGAPYRSVLAGAQALEPEELKARAEDLELGVVPGWAGFVTAAVDVQGNRFDCQAIAWGADGRAQVIDVWQIFKTRDVATGIERMLEPARRAEDWDLLTAQTVGRTWRGVAGAEFNARIVAVDSGGADGTTGQAYDWWHRLRRQDPALMRRVMLLKGDARRDAALISLRQIETDARGRRIKRGIALALVNTEALKDQVELKLRMARPGPGWLHLSRHLPERFWEEATAERRGPKGWERHRPRNESWDLLVYNLAAWHRLGGPRLNWAFPAEWHKPRAGLLLAEAGSMPDAAPAPPPPPQFRPRWRPSAAW